MPLINCPECQKEISDQAPACPNCGYPLHRPQVQAPVKQEKDWSQELLWFVVVFVVIGTLTVFLWPSNKDVSDNTNANSTQTRVSNNRSNSNPPPANYNGVYHDLDQSTGWETTIRIAGNYFSAVTVSNMTGEIIASTSGELKGSNLIDEYGQSVGSVSNYYASINVGSAHIQCNKQ